MLIDRYKRDNSDYTGVGASRNPIYKQNVTPSYSAKPSSLGSHNIGGVNDPPGSFSYQLSG